MRSWNIYEMNEEVKHNYTLRFMSQFNLVGVYVQGLFYHQQKPYDVKIF